VNLIATTVTALDDKCVTAVRRLRYDSLEVKAIGDMLRTFKSLQIMITWLDHFRVARPLAIYSGTA
jgi:hypothetical protein